MPHYACCRGVTALHPNRHVRTTPRWSRPEISGNALLSTHALGDALFGALPTSAPRVPQGYSKFELQIRMRPLTEEERKAVFEKLHKYLGKNIKQLVEKKGEDSVFRLHKNKIFYVRESVLRRASHVAGDNLKHLGSCIGKLTHGGNFRLTIGCLDLLAAHARYKVWVKPAAEMSFLYGNHVLKSGLGRITEATPTNAGVLLLSMSDVPLGFGVTAKSTSECRTMEPSGIVVLHQADVGEYLRSESDL